MGQRQYLTKRPYVALGKLMNITKKRGRNTKSMKRSKKNARKTVPSSWRRRSALWTPRAHEAPEPMCTGHQLSGHPYPQGPGHRAHGPPLQLLDTPNVFLGIARGLYRAHKTPVRTAPLHRAHGPCLRAKMRNAPCTP